MQSENEYIGDDKFKKFLDHYKCPTTLDVVKMKFAGAVCSPNLDLRPTDVISSFWPENEQPRLETKKEAELFFKFFMGLWDEIFKSVKANKITLPTFNKDDKANLSLWCQKRYEQIELGYLEGFWGGCDDLKIPEFLAQITDSLSELADLYPIMAKRAFSGDDVDEINKTLNHTDKMAERAIHFIIENSVLPRINNLQRKTN